MKIAGKTIEIVERPPVKVASLRYTGPFGDPLGRFWRVTVAPWLADHGLLDCPRFGVSIDNPRVTPAQKCRYDACVELPTGLAIPNATEITIPGGRYAVTPYKGNSSDILIAWGAFVGLALANSTQRIDSRRHPFEHYPRGAGFDARTGVFACELCLPLID